MSTDADRTKYFRGYKRKRRAEERAAKVAKGIVVQVGRPKKKPPVLRPSATAWQCRLLLLEGIFRFRKKTKTVLVPWHNMKAAVMLQYPDSKPPTQLHWLKAVSLLVNEGFIPEPDYSRRGWPKAIRIPSRKIAGR